MRRGAGIALFVALAVAEPGPAQSYPTRPLRLIVPFPAGGAADVLGRSLAQGLAESLGRPVLVDNRVGGAGTVGTEHAARAEPDGHTLLLAATSHVVNPSLQARIPYDPIKDFAAVTQLSALHSVLVVHPVLPVRTVADLITLARRHPGKLNYASGGNGTSQHLSGELFKSMARVDLVHVPYKGGAPALNDLLGGHVEVMFATLPSVLAQVRSGRLRALGSTGAQRAHAAPEIPTVAEQGVGGYDSVGWQGLLVPARTPHEVVARLHRETISIMNTSAMRERLLGIGFDLVTGSPAQFAELLGSDLLKWGRVVRQAGVRAD